MYFNTQQKMQEGTETYGTHNMKWIKITVNVFRTNTRKYSQFVVNYQQFFLVCLTICGACALSVNMTSIWKLNF